MRVRVYHICVCACIIYACVRVSYMRVCVYISVSYMRVCVYHMRVYKCIIYACVRDYMCELIFLVFRSNYPVFRGMEIQSLCHCT